MLHAPGVAELQLQSLASMATAAALLNGADVSGIDATPINPANPPLELAQLAEDFCNRYPVDANAMDYLLSSPTEVQARVVQEFRPPHEGEGDYSALLTAFVKRCRADMRIAAPRQDPGGLAGSSFVQQPAVEVTQTSVDAFFARYPVDDRARDYFGCSRQEIQEKVMREFRPPREGEQDYSSLFMSFVKRCRSEVRYGHPAAPSGAPAPLTFEVPKALGGTWTGTVTTSGRAPPPAAGPAHGLESFALRYPIDDRARDYFSTAPVEVQERVLREFRPQREGEADYSMLFMAFVKRCRQFQRQDSWNAQPQPRHALQGGGAPITGELGQPAANVEVLGPGVEGLEAFSRRFPIDDRCFNFLAESSAEVRERVVNTFVPPRPNDTDFSGPVTAYIRECRRVLPPGPGLSLPSAAPTYAPQGHASSNGGGQGGGQGAENLPNVAAAAGLSSEELNLFLQRFPIDARAVDYLGSSTPVVVGRVIREFAPRQEGETDYSALVMAYIKRCRGDERSGWEPSWKRARAF